MIHGHSVHMPKFGQIRVMMQGKEEEVYEGQRLEHFEVALQLTGLDTVRFQNISALDPGSGSGKRLVHMIATYAEQQLVLFRSLQDTLESTDPESETPDAANYKEPENRQEVEETMNLLGSPEVQANLNPDIAVRLLTALIMHARRASLLPSSTLH